MEKRKRPSYKKKYLESEAKIRKLEYQINSLSDVEEEKKALFENLRQSKKSRNSIVDILSLIIAIIVAGVIVFQTRIFNRQTKIFENQTKVLQSQDSLISEQNGLFKKQNDKFDLQNDLFKLQNDLVDIQNDKTEVQNSLVSLQNRLFEKQNKRIDQQTNLQEAERRSSLVFLFNNVLDKIDEELKDSLNTNNSLSHQLIGRVIALTHALKPYKYLENDTIIKRPVSPEKGQLLISLLNSNLNENSLFEIFKKADFKYSELKYANLSNIVFTNIDLSYSNLENSNCNNTIFRNCNLQFVKMKNAKLYKSKFIATKIIDSDLSYTYGGYITFENCELNKVSFVGANIPRSHFFNYYKYKLYFGESNSYLNYLKGDKKTKGKVIENYSLVLYEDHKYNDSEKKNYLHKIIKHSTQGGNIKGSRFLKDVNFFKAALSGSTIESIILKKCNFRQAHLNDINFKNTVIEEGTYFDKAKIDRKSFEENFINTNSRIISIGDYYSLKYYEPETSLTNSYKRLAFIMDNQTRQTLENDIKENYFLMKKKQDYPKKQMNNLAPRLTVIE